MPCTLTVRHDLSIADIEALAKNHLLEVTPHVGNWTPARLVLPTLGCLVLCVDHTIGGRDRNAHPHLLIEGGVVHPLSAHEDRLTTHATVTEPALGHVFGKPVSAVHVDTVRALYPQARIVTHSEYLAMHRALTLTVIECVMEITRSGVWWRRVDEDGAVTCYQKKHLPRTFAEVRDDIFRLSNERSGWLVHNRIAILMDILLQSEMGREPVLYHLSGPDMVRYLGREMEMLSRMYDHVRARLALPQELVEINLIPFASFPFATRESQADACVGLVEALSVATHDPRRVADCLSGASDVLVHSETLPYFTQHDCVQTGERIVVPEVARRLPMALCARYGAYLQGMSL